MTWLSNPLLDEKNCHDIQSNAKIKECNGRKRTTPRKNSNCGRISRTSSFSSTAKLSADKYRVVGKKKYSDTNPCASQLAPKLKKSCNGSQMSLKRKDSGYGTKPNGCDNYASKKLSRSPTVSYSKLCTSPKAAKKGSDHLCSSGNWCDCRQLPTKQIDCEKKACVIPQQGEHIGKDWWCDCRGANKNIGKNVCVRPGPIIPKSNLHTADAALQSDTTYKVDYPGKYVNPRAPIMHHGSMHPGDGPLSSETTHKADYQAKPHSKREPIYHPNNMTTSNMPIEGESTTHHDYREPRGFIPSSSFRPKRGCPTAQEAMQDETTHRADYIDWHSRGPQGPFSWTPSNKYAQPVIPMNGDTIYKTDYQPYPGDGRRAPFEPKTGTSFYDRLHPDGFNTTYKDDYLGHPGYCMRDEIRAKDNLHASGDRFDDRTTQKEDYRGWHADPAKLMLPKQRKQLGDGPMSSDTTHKVDYQPKPLSKRDPIYPMNEMLTSNKPMEGETTTHHDYQEPRGFIPSSSFRPKRGCPPPPVAMQDETTHRADYIDWHSRGPQGPFSWTPSNKYAQPNIPMIGDTTYGVSYKEPGYSGKVPPILQKDQGIGIPGNAFDDCTTYKRDYIPWECVNENELNAMREIKCYKLEGETPQDQNKKLWCYKSNGSCPYYPPEPIAGPSIGTTQYVVRPSEGEKPCKAPSGPFNKNICDPDVLRVITCNGAAQKTYRNSYDGCQKPSSAMNQTNEYSCSSQEPKKEYMKSYDDYQKTYSMPDQTDQYKCSALRAEKEYSQGYDSCQKSERDQHHGRSHDPCQKRTPNPCPTSQYTFASKEPEKVYLGPYDGYQKTYAIPDPCDQYKCSTLRPEKVYPYRIDDCPKPDSMQPQTSQYNCSSQKEYNKPYDPCQKRTPNPCPTSQYTFASKEPEKVYTKPYDGFKKTYAIPDPCDQYKCSTLRPEKVYPYRIDDCPKPDSMQPQTSQYNCSSQKEYKKPYDPCQKRTPNPCPTSQYTFASKEPEKVYTKPYDGFKKTYAIPDPCDQYKCSTLRPEKVYPYRIDDCPKPDSMQPQTSQYNCSSQKEYKKPYDPCQKRTPNPCPTSQYTFASKEPEKVYTKPYDGFKKTYAIPDPCDQYKCSAMRAETAYTKRYDDCQETEYTEQPHYSVLNTWKSYTKPHDDSQKPTSYQKNSSNCLSQERENMHMKSHDGYQKTYAVPDQSDEYKCSAMRAEKVNTTNNDCYQTSGQTMQTNRNNSPAQQSYTSTGHEINSCITKTQNGGPYSATNQTYNSCGCAMRSSNNYASISQNSQPVLAVHC